MSFGKEAEERLMGYVREVQAHVSNGDSPDEAVVKVAQEHQIQADMLPLLVQAHNVGRQAYQREKCSGKGILCKVADFPIARIENIHSALFPSQPVSPVLKTAGISAEYSRPPVMPDRYRVTAREKQASASLPASMTHLPERECVVDPKTKVARMQAAKMKVAREIDDAKVVEIQARDQFLAAMGRVADYFKQASYDRLSLAEVEWNSLHMFGPLARDVINFSCARNQTKEARASGPPRLARPVSQTLSPYSWVKVAIDKAKDYVQASNLVHRLEKEAQGKIDAIMRPFSGHFPKPPMTVFGQPEPDFSGQKQAGLFGPLMTGFSVNAMRNIGNIASPTATSSMVDSAVDKLDDPLHDEELKMIEARQQINNLIKNDGVIGTFPPDVVASAWNEIVQLSPASAIQPAIMRPLLRKRLTSGAMEPFEAQQLAEMEKTVRQTEAVGNARNSYAISGSPALA